MDHINNSTHEHSIKTQKQKKERCYFSECNKKLKMVDLKCHCGHLFCSLHRLPESHECNFDFKTKGREDLRKSLDAKIKKTNLHSKGTGGIC